MQTRNHRQRFTVFGAVIGLTLISLCFTGHCLADSIVVDANDVRKPDEYKGPLPWVVVALGVRAYDLPSYNPHIPWNTGSPGTSYDILPPGPDNIAGGAWYVHALLDTGSITVVFTEKTSIELGLTPPQTVNLRVNGLQQIDPATLFAPIGNGYFLVTPSSDPAYYEVHDFDAPNIERTLTVGKYNRDKNLIGMPVVQDVITLIDYGEKAHTEVGPYTQFTDCPDTDVDERIFQGPAITFYEADDLTNSTPEGKKTEVSIRLRTADRPNNSADGVDAASRWYMPNVSFKRGTRQYSGREDEVTILYDSGTSHTRISTRAAAALGLVPDTRNSDFVCRQTRLEGIPSDPCDPAGETTEMPGYILDKVVMHGEYGSTYTVKNARVCVVADQTGPDIVLGSNLFDQVQVLINGPDDRLQIVTDALRPPTLRILG